MKRLVKNKSKSAARAARHRRIRARVRGTAALPRLSVFRSLKAIEAQLVDDEKAVTLCSVRLSDAKGEKAEGKTGKVAASFLAGKQLAEKAKAKGIAKVVFDRGGYRYHGRVAAVADGARAGGLQF